MKLKNILYTGMALLSLTACNDFLDVEAPSAYTEEFVFSQKTEMERALNGVYAQALVNDLYGNAYQRTFILNSDVDIQISQTATHSRDTYARLDCDAQGSDINKFWTAAYSLIEYANKFIRSAENSPLYDTNDGELMQWIGEAKCLRAMAYHDLVVMFGDIPFTFSPASEHGNNFVIPVADRQEVQDALINDLKEIAPYMSPASSVTVENCSKEFAQAMIARIALTAGGYSLRPDKSRPSSYGTMQRPENYLDYYKTARDYADLVITAGGHSLTNSYQDVFVKECNYEVVNDDDPIFEIPFAKYSTGNTGYIQGPSYSDYEGKTVGPWGKCEGNTRLNAFYRFLFRDKDMRREFVNGLWYYTYVSNADGTMSDSIVFRNDYYVHNNKWSKLWTGQNSALGSETNGSTGINFPYMRYADVLLMFAEADNELTDMPSDKAVECLAAVHERAFRSSADKDAAFISAAKASKDAFRKAVLNERKWEFAGENMRWRDLVRTNTYAEELVYSFLRYHSAGLRGRTGFEDAIYAHDESTEYLSDIPLTVYYHRYTSLAEPDQRTLSTVGSSMYGNVIGTSNDIIQEYPNSSLKKLRIYNPYSQTSSAPNNAFITMFGFKESKWDHVDLYDWRDGDADAPKDQCKYSFYGFIRSDNNGTIYLIRDGVATFFPATVPDASELPVVRYILPYPNAAIQRSNGAYKNYYGY